MISIRTLLLLFALLSACGPAREISIPQSRLQSDPDRYQDWIVRVHLRGDVEFVENDSLVVLRRATHTDPVVSCVMQLAWAGGMPSSVSVGVGAGPGLGRGMPPKLAPVHGENQIIELDEFEFADDRLIAWIDVPEVDGHRYFVRAAELDSLLVDPCTCIHPGYRELEERARVVIPEDLIYRFSGLSPQSVPGGAVSERATGGFLGSGLGLPPEWRDPLRDAPYKALASAAAGQDSLALETIRLAIHEATRNELWPHDEFYDHFVALLLIHTARGEIREAADAAAHLMHFGEFELPTLASARSVVHGGSALGNFLDERGAALGVHWPELRDQLSARYPSTAR